MLAAPCRIVHDGKSGHALPHFWVIMAPCSRLKDRWKHERSMPTLFRFLMVVGVIAGVITGSLYVLAEYFQPEPKEISKALRNVKARMEETAATTPSADTGAISPAAIPDPGPDPDELAPSKGAGRRAQ
ncbi:MAG: hypothetical protein WBW51_05065 [Methyloceanibacter sp.]